MLKANRPRHSCPEGQPPPSHKKEQRQGIIEGQPPPSHKREQRQGIIEGQPPPSHKREQRQGIIEGQPPPSHKKEQRQGIIEGQPPPSHKKEQRQDIIEGQPPPSHKREQRQGIIEGQPPPSHKREQRQGIIEGQPPPSHKKEQRQGILEVQPAPSHKKEQRQGIIVGQPPPSHKREQRQGIIEGQPPPSHKKEQRQGIIEGQPPPSHKKEQRQGIIEGQPPPSHKKEHRRSIIMTSPATVAIISDGRGLSTPEPSFIRVCPSANGHGRTAPPPSDRCISDPRPPGHDLKTSSLSSESPQSSYGTDERKDHNAESREPFIFVKWVANRPRLSFAIALSVHVFFLLLSGVLFVSGYDLFPANFENLPMDLHDEPWLKRDLAWQNKDEFANSVDRSLPSSKYPTWDRAFTKETLLLFYDTGSGNVFTKSRLRAMQAIEDELVGVAQFSSYCQMTQAGNCTPPVSVLRFFDGTFASLDTVFNDPNFDNITSVLYAAYTYNETKSAFVYALGKSNTVTSSVVTSTVTRTMIPLGWPLPGFTDEDAMKDELAEFMADHLKPVLDRYLDSSAFEFVYYNGPLMFYEVRQQAFYDMALALGSMVFIFCFILFHTRSLWVTCLAELSIVCSFVETNLIYRVVIGFRYFGYFHVLAMFIILGIGADDLFVFWDAWTATGLQKHPSLAHRLNEAYRKSVISMLVTSLTTMTAFLANALSPLLATRSFGVFAAALIGIDYLSVITFFPTIVIFYHLHFEDKPHPCYCCCRGEKKKGDDKGGIGKSDEEEGKGASYKYTDETKEETLPPSGRQSTVPAIAQTHHQSPQSKHSTITFHGGQSTSFPPTAGLNRKPSVTTAAFAKTADVNHNTEKGRSERDADVSETGAKPSKLVIFFRDYYYAFVTHKIARWVIVVVLLGCLVGFAVSASHLEPDNEQIQLYTDSHHYSKAIKLNNYGFVPNDMEKTITVYLVWGLGERDLSSCHFSEVECQGTQRYDGSFDISTEAAQLSFVSICDTLLNFTAAQAADLAIRRDLTTGQLEVACFPSHMETFLKNDPALSGNDVSMPWNWTQTSDFMTTLNNYYNISAFDSNFTRFLDIPLTYWIWDAFNQNNTLDYQMYNSLFGEEVDGYSNPVLTAPSITTGNRIKYMAISVNTTLRLQSLGYEEGIPIVESWEKFMENQLRTMPPEMKGGFQTTILAWHWLYVQRSLAENAILGVAVGVSLAFPVLVVSTFNVINGLLATLTICCVTVCVIGVIPLGGWKLGVLVSLNMCLVVGLAVDFVVHLAEGYHMAHEQDRKGRIRSSLERMGVSVFSGACTTLGASAFMLFAKIQFFFQFGIFMFCTIGFSLVFSMGLYVTVMGILGPEGETGDIRALYRKCSARVRTSKHNEGTT